MTQKADDFYRLCLEAFERKDFEQARVYLAEAIESASDYDTTYLWERVSLAGNADSDREIPDDETQQVLSDLGRIIKNTSAQLKQALVDRALWQTYKGTPAEVEYNLDQLIALGEDKYSWRAELRAKRGDYLGAIDDMSKAYTLQRNWENLLGRGFNSYRAGLYDKAIADYNTILSELLDDHTHKNIFAAVYYHLGRAYYRKDQKKLALKAFQEMSRYRGTSIFPKLDDYSSEINYD